MFTDMSISADLNNKFSDFTTKEKIDLGVNFSILVLQVSVLLHTYLNVEYKVRIKDC